jgi:hypothetical protein
MRRITNLSLAALLIICAIASFAATSSFSYGTIQASCAPWDGPAVEIRLTKQPTECKQATEPYISLAIWRGIPIHAGQVVKLGPGSDAGSAARCTKAGDCKLAQSASITFEKYDEASGVAGHYELQFKDGENLKGTFDVKWCKERVVCG